MIKNIQRLLFIEAKLILHDCVVRKDIAHSFMVSAITATRDLVDYRQLAPHNIAFQASPKKQWVSTATFEPILFVSNKGASVEEQAAHYLDTLLAMYVACATCNQIEEVEHNEAISAEMA